MLTYFGRFANDLAVDQRHPGQGSRGVVWQDLEVDHCADAAGALSWAAETYRVFARDAKAYNSSDGDW